MCRISCNAVTGVIDKDECLMLTIAPIVGNSLFQLADSLTKVFIVDILDLTYIYIACSQSHYSLSYVPCVLSDLVNVSEAFILWHVVAQHIVVPIFDDDPFVKVGFETCIYHWGVFFAFLINFF